MLFQDDVDWAVAQGYRVNHLRGNARRVLCGMLRGRTFHGLCGATNLDAPHLRSYIREIFTCV